MYIFDLEGTLSDHKHRLHLLPTLEEKKAGYKNGRKDDLYTPFHSEFLNDKPHIGIVKMARACAYNLERVVILTGMMEKNRMRAQEWLMRHGIPYNDLIMRKNDDFSTSPEYKLRWIKTQREIPLMVFDDRQDVIDRMLENNIPAMLVTL